MNSLLVLAITVLVAAASNNHVQAAPVEQDWQSSLRADMQQLVAQDSQKLVDNICAASAFYSAGLVGRVRSTASAPLPSYASVASAMYDGLVFDLPQLEDPSAALDQHFASFGQVSAISMKSGVPPAYVSVVATHPQAFSSQPMPIVSAGTISSVQNGIASSAVIAGASPARMDNFTRALAPASGVAGGPPPFRSIGVVPAVLNSTATSMQQIAVLPGIAAAWGSIVPQSMNFVSQSFGQAAAPEDRCLAASAPAIAPAFLQAAAPTAASIQAIEGAYTSTIRPSLVSSYTRQMTAACNATTAQRTAPAFAGLIDNHFRQLMLQASPQRATNMLAMVQTSLCRWSSRGPAGQVTATSPRLLNALV